ncbi:hypothetical protein Ndes2437B_g06151 [Nannochloris sp. 'desiccata']|nr:hypothetical protein KSW81_008089 [Chlorella desiccata (nom. nud.)]
MSEGGLDLRSFLLHSSEPQTSRSRQNINKTKTSNNKENRDSKAGNKGPKVKKQPERIPLDKAQIERFFSAAENVVFASHHPRPQLPPSPTPGAPGIQDLALLNRLSISSPRRNCGSPMSIENYPTHNRGCSPFPEHVSPKPPTQPLPSLPPQPRHLSAEEIDLIYRQRCAIDSDAMLASCPPHLFQVNQTFLKQAEAVKLADQCNAGLPVVVEPELLLSKVNEVPRKPQVIGGAKSLQNNVAAGGALQPPLPQPSSAKERESNAATEAPAAGASDPSSIIRLAGDVAEQPLVVHNFSFNFEEYRQGGDEVAAGGSEQQEQPEASGEDKEGSRKRARSDESAAFMQQLQENYAAALAQLNASPAAPPPEAPLRQHGDATAPPGVVAKPAVSGDSSSSSHGLLAPPLNVPRRTQEAIRVFCIEKENERTGLFYRNFTATSYANVWRAYNNSRPGALHWYEVVREGRPCHLYFDLEFARSSVQNWNSNVDGDALVDTLLHHVGVILERNWGLVFDPQTQTYELDSSTPEKFSRHLIVRIPGHAFFHNLAIGHFVSQVIAAAGTELDVFKNPPPSEERVSFVDTAVYTKNRHFRLVYSSKGGKTAILKPTERYATGIQGISRLSPARIFNDTLICNVDYDVKLLAVLPPLRNASLLPTMGGVGALGIAAAAADGGTSRAAGATTNNNGAASGGNGGGIHQGDVYGRSIAWKQNELVAPDADVSSGGGEGNLLKELKSVAETAVPFIEEAAKQRSGQDARARTVAFCGMDGLVAYSMIGPGSHYCEHIGRAHKNNHVYFVANFSGGVYAQKCHDPDCSRFRSAWMPLPKEMCLDLREEGAQKDAPQQKDLQ